MTKFKKILVLALIGAVFALAIFNQYYRDISKKEQVDKYLERYDGYAESIKPDENGIMILCYHRISNDNTITKISQDISLSMQLKSFNVNVDDFEKQMKFLRDNNVNVISIEKAYQMVKKGPVKGKYVVVTFDDIDKTINNAIPILHKYKIPYTTFIIGSQVDHYLDGTFMANWNDIEKLNKDPLNTMGYHTYDAHYQVRGKPYLTIMGRKKFKQDLQKLDDVMAQHNIKNVQYYAPPYGAINKSESKYLVNKCGFKMILSLENGLLTDKSQFYDTPRMIVTNKSFKNMKRWLDV